MNAYRIKSLLARIITVIFLVGLLCIMLFPFFIVIINAFKNPSEYASLGPMKLPGSLYLEGIINFWKRVDFSNKLWNSFIISFSVAILGIILSLLNAFALGIGKIRGRFLILVFFIVANTLPHEALAYPLYYFAKTLGIYDTRLSVILIFMVIQAAFGTYLLSNVFSAFPMELIEAAYVDGAKKMQILQKIVVPVSFPTLAVLFTFFFIWTWNEFFLPLIMLISNSNQTVPIAISLTQGQHNMDVTTASASALLGMLPCFLFFIIFQRTLTRGITAGSIK